MIRNRNLVAGATGLALLVTGVLPVHDLSADVTTMSLTPTASFNVDAVGIADMDEGRVIGLNADGSKALVEKFTPNPEVVYVDIATETSVQMTADTDEPCDAQYPESFSSALSLDGSSSAWVVNDGEVNQLWLRATNGDSPIQIGGDDIWCPGIRSTVALDGDGSHVAYVRHYLDGETENAELVVEEVGGDSVVIDTVEYSLASTGSDIVSPVLSDDGSRVAYAVYGPEDGWFLRVKDVSDPSVVVGTDRRLDNDDGGPSDYGLRAPSMSADGETLAWIQVAWVNVAPNEFSPPALQAQGELLHVGAVAADPETVTVIEPLAADELADLGYDQVRIAPNGGAIVFTANTEDPNLPSPSAFRLKLPASNNDAQLLGLPLLDEPQAVQSIATDDDASNMAYSLRWLLMDDQGLNGFIRETVVSVVPASTGNLTRPTVEWTVPTSGGWTRIGATVAVTSRAPSGSDRVEATISIKRWEGDTEVSDEVVVRMDESAGTYSATWTIPEGTTEISGVAVTATRDASSSSRTSSSPAVPVAGAVDILNVSVPAADFYLTLSNGRTGFTVRRTVVDGEGTTMSTVVPGDYRLKLFEPTGRERSSQSVSVTRGRTTEIASLEVGALGTLAVTIDTGDDDGSLIGTWVTLTKHSDGQFISSGFVTSGNEVAFDGLTIDEQVDIEVSGLPRLLSAEVKTVTIEEVTTETIVAEPPVTMEFSGVVYRSDRRPAAGATITISQWTGSDGFRTRTMRVGADGGYSLTILDPDSNPGINQQLSTLSWTTEYNGSFEAGQIALPGSGDVTLTDRVAEAVVVTIRYEGATGTPPQLDDWRAFRHNWVRTYLDGVPYYAPIAAAPLDRDTTSGIFNVFASEGQEFQVCADGSEAGYGKGCGTVSIVAGESNELTVTLPEQTKFEARLLAGGSPVTAETVWALYKEVDSTWAEQRSYTVLPDEDGHVIVSHDAGPGRYRLQFVQGLNQKSITFSVGATGETKNLGNIVLESQSWFSVSTASVVSDRTEVAVGSRLSLRFELTPVTDMTGVTATVPLPTNTSLVTGSVLKNGTAIGGGDVVVDSQQAVLSLGNLTAEFTYVIRYQIDVGANFGTGVVPTAVAMAMTVPDFGVQEAQIPGAAVKVVAVTIDAPGTVQSLSLTVTGRAPANQLVTVTSKGAVVGGATASSTGRWSATVVLPDRGSGYTYPLSASVTSPDFAQATTTVWYDTTTPVVTNACISQPIANSPWPRPGDAEYCFDPRLGVAVFPFVFVPDVALRVELEVDRPNLVAEAIVHIGSKSGVATKQSNDKFVASVMGDGRGAIEIELVGRRSEPTAPLTYLGSLAAQLNPGDGQLDDNELGVLDLLVPGGLTNPSVNVTTDDDTTFEATVAAESSLSDSWLANPDITTSIKFERTTYTPTAVDSVNFSRRALPIYGLPLQGLGVVEGEEGDNRFRTFEFYVDLGALGLSWNDPAELSLQDAGGVSTYNGAVLNVLKVTGRWLVGKEGINNGFGVINGIIDPTISAATAGGKYEEMANMHDLIGGCLSAGQIRDYSDDLSSLANMAATVDVASSALNVLGVLAAPETFGLGTLAIWGSTWLVGKATDYIIGEETSRIREEILAARSRCENQTPIRRTNDNDPYLGRRTKIGDPRWIYDPSGYAYEGSQTARIKGVTATLLYSEFEDGPFRVFDMGPYDQVNPLVTNDEGRYGWDVPEGWWKVYFTKPGYEPTFSDTVQVLPPHFDVHGNMRKTTAPVVTDYSATGRGVDVTFDQPMRTSSIAAVSSVSQNSRALTGTWSAVSPMFDDDGIEVATTFRFYPNGGVRGGNTYSVRIGANVQDHTGRAMLADASGNVTATSGTGGGGRTGTTRSPGVALPGVPVSLAGDDRVGTALAIVDADFEPLTSRQSATTFDTPSKLQAGAAVVVSSSSFADSLSAGPLAVSKNAPLYLTDGATLDPRVASSLTQYVPPGSTVYVVGGDRAISSGVESSLRDIGFVVQRLAGADRYETSVIVALFGLGGPSNVVLATGLDFPDGLTAGVVAARTGGAVLLTQGEVMPASVSQYLRGGQTTGVIAVGGPAARAYPAARPLQGTDRYATAVTVAVAFPPSGSLVGVASGRSFADGLAAAPYLARRGSVLLLTSDSDLPASTADFIRSRRPGVATAQVFGGLSVVPDTIRRKISGLFA